MKKLISILIFISLAIASVANAATILKSGIWKQNNHEYILVKSNVTWWGAADDMKNILDDYYKGGLIYLATFTSKEEQDFVASLFKGYEGHYFIGGYQGPYSEGQKPEDDWNWITGEKWEYTHWGPGEPNDDKVPEQYLAMLLEHTTLARSFTWNDTLGNVEDVGYIAEMARVVPIPAAVWLLGAGLIALLGLRRRSKS